MTLKQALIFFLFIIYLPASGQKSAAIDPTQFNYAHADSIALNCPKIDYKSYTELVDPLTKNLITEHEKFRVLFRWITDNISYSNSNTASDANKVVLRKKAVCIGYSNLLKEMCHRAGIKCEVIIGYSKTIIEDINKKLSETDHAWNAVMLNNKWYLADVTWATSAFDKKKRRIIKEFDEHYFLTPPEKFIKNHFPKNKKWQLLDNSIKKSEFIKPPIYYSGYYLLDIDKLEPSKGIIKMKLKDSLQINFSTHAEIQEIGIELGTKQLTFNPVIRANEKYKFSKQKFERPGEYEMTLFFDGYPVAAYRLEIKE